MPKEYGYVEWECKEELARRTKSKPADWISESVWLKDDLMHFEKVDGATENEAFSKR